MNLTPENWSAVVVDAAAAVVVAAAAADDCRERHAEFRKHAILADQAQ